jgi:BlaI family transcriptional regulator, penicillinase repressor
LPQFALSVNDQDCAWDKTVKTQALSAAETEVMLVLWGIGSGSVADIQSALRPERDIAYTTVATLLSRMEVKGAVVSKKSGRSYVFSPLATKADFQQNKLSGLVQQFFEGRPSSLASHFIKTNSFSEQELAELRLLLDQKENK